MRLFVYEWTCCVDSPPVSLGREGWAMLNAVLQDLANVPQLEAATLLHRGFNGNPPCRSHRLADARAERACFHELAGSADATLVIAPESCGILLERCKWVENAGGRLLGPSPVGVALTSDKFQLCKLWQEHGVPTPQCYVAESQVTFPAVLKPRDGAGSQSTFLVRSESERVAALQSARDAGTEDLVVQPYITGIAASIAFLIGDAVCLPLLPTAQLLSDDGRFSYLGGHIPLQPGLAKRALALGKQAIDAVSGLRGYVGVDLVLGDAGDFAIEINPRLTTSYIGLRALCQDNLGHAMVRVALGQRIEELRWRQESLRFSGDGVVETRSVLGSF